MTAEFACKQGTITGFAFANFGTPNGDCGGSFSPNARCSVNVTEKLVHLCAGRSNCSVAVNKSTLTGGMDPCYGVHKWLSAAATCSSPAPPDTGISVESFNVSAWEVKAGYSRRNSASLVTSDETLNRVWELCRYTIDKGPLDLYTDSNARQRSADCLADDQTAARGTYAVSGSLALQRYAMEQAIAVGPANLVDWRVIPIFQARDYLMHTGDIDWIKVHLDYLHKNHACLEYIDNTSGLVKGINALVDWPMGMQDRYVSNNHSTISSTWVAAALRALAELARAVGRNSDAAFFDTTAEGLVQRINTLMWNGTAFCDGVCSEVEHTAFHSTMYPMAFGIVDEAHHSQAWHYLRSRIDPPFGTVEADTQAGHAVWPPPPPPGAADGMPCSSYAAQFALEALYSNHADHGQSALQVLTSNAMNSWVTMLNSNATMTMEMWTTDEKPNLDWSHPWSASPAFIVPWFLFGIRPTSPGFDTIEIAPQPGNLRHGTYELPTIKGRLRVEFGKPGQANGQGFQLNVTIPPAVFATIYLPHLAPVGTAVFVEVDGVSAVANIETIGRAKIQHLGPGLHTVTAEDVMQFV